MFIFLGILLALFMLWVFLIFLPSLAMYTVRVNIDRSQLNDHKLWNWRAYVNPHAYGKWLGEQAQVSLQATHPHECRYPHDAPQGASQGHTEPLSFGGQRIASDEVECVVCGNVWRSALPGFEPCPACGR